MLVYGGENNRGGYLNDFWLLDLSSKLFLINFFFFRFLKKKDSNS